MIKKIGALSLLLIMLILPVTAFAEQGIGIVLGEPTGLSYKTGNLAIGLGWSFATADSRIDATADWWLINDHLIEMFDWYLGAGIKLGLNLNNDIFNIGFRVPIGVQWWPVEQLEIFLEIAPGILLIPATEPDIGAGLGLRYHF
ncbi:MAG: hypothetical protein KAQ93_06440 [Spirochaetales bacterium]|nr:hypothetical protein [Spirochaetales bacterium]